jgi:hypothetical protein
MTAEHGPQVSKAKNKKRPSGRFWNCGELKYLSGKRKTGLAGGEIGRH